jgi:hypothetical protein
VYIAMVRNLKLCTLVCRNLDDSKRYKSERSSGMLDASVVVLDTCNAIFLNCSPEYTCFALELNLPDEAHFVCTELTK